MKRILFLAGLVAMGVTAAKADFQNGDQTLQFSLGSAGYPHDVDVNNGDDPLKNHGGAGGIQYLYFIHHGPTLAVGPDILWADVSERDASRILADSGSHGSEHTTVYQAVAKLAYPSGHWRPYVLGGLGISRSSLQGDITPLAGAQWADTGTSEPRSTFDSIRYGFAGTWGLGMDWFPREHWFLGFELRQVKLSRLEHAPTAAGRSLGIQPVRDPSAITSLLLRFGYKFGAN